MSRAPGIGHARCGPLREFAMFALFERLLKPTVAPEGPGPPPGLVGVLLAFRAPGEAAVRRAVRRRLLVACSTRWSRSSSGIVTLVTSATGTLFADNWPMLPGMALLLLFVRPAASRAQNLLANQAIAANVSNRIRWQNHWHVVRQSWAFFQNDFAGRIANRVMQTGPAIRETIVALITSVWYILVYGTSAAAAGARGPVARAPDRAMVLRLSRAAARVRAAHARPLEGDVGVALTLTGRIVDSYTNILTVKLFARAREEDAYVREALEQHTGRFHRSLRLNTLFSFCLGTLNAMMVTGTGRHRDAAVVARPGRGRHRRDGDSAHLADRSVAGWVAYQITAIFENVGVVQEGMMTIARPIGLIDAAGGAGLEVSAARSRSRPCASAMAARPCRRGRTRKPFAVIDGLTLR